MLNQIKKFKGNAVALELTGTFTKEDVKLMELLFEEKLNNGSITVNILFKLKDISQFKHADLKALFCGEVWGFRHFNKIGHCAIVAHSDFIKYAVDLEGKPLHLISNTLDERYFDEGHLDEALRFINPD